MIETNNTLSNPEGPEWQFLVGEGKTIPAENASTAISRDKTDLGHRNLRSQGRPPSRDTAPSSLRSASRQSQSIGDHTASCDRWHAALSPLN